MTPAVPAGDLERSGLDLFSHPATPESYHQDGPPAQPSYDNLFGEPERSAGQSRHEPHTPDQTRSTNTAGQALTWSN